MFDVCKTLKIKLFLYKNRKVFFEKNEKGHHNYKNVFFNQKYLKHQKGYKRKFGEELGTTVPVI